MTRCICSTAYSMIQTDLNFIMHVPTSFLFGAGKLKELHAQELPGKKAMLIISNGKSVRANGSLDHTIEELRKAGADYVLFDRIQANPLKTTVEEGGKLARREGCDFLVALGGGSVIDSAKAIAVMATNDGDLWDYMKGGTGRGLPIANRPLPIVAITTTAGTGSEADPAGVITDPETHEKQGISHPLLFPVLSIIDPELMRTVPPLFTAYQGFDALFHSTEGYISNRTNLIGDMFEEAAIRNVGAYLVRACRDGNDMEARTRMAFANTMSGFAMVTSGCTAEHSIEHALSAYHEALPHGAGLIMISLAYYRNIIDKHVCDERFIQMAKWLGKEDAACPEDFLTALSELQQACDVADLKMSDYGITPDEFDAMASNAETVMGKLIAFDHIPLTHQEIIGILQQSYR